MEDTVNVLYQSSDAYAPIMGVSITSLLESAVSMEGHGKAGTARGEVSQDREIFEQDIADAGFPGVLPACVQTLLGNGFENQAEQLKGPGANIN